MMRTSDYKPPSPARWYRAIQTAFLSISLGLPLGACSQDQFDRSGTTTFRLYTTSSSDVVQMVVPDGYLDHFVLAGPPVAGAREDRPAIHSDMYFVAEADTLRPRAAGNEGVFNRPRSLTEELRFNLLSFHMRRQSDVPGAIQWLLQASQDMTFHACPELPMPQKKYGLDFYALDSRKCQQVAPSLEDIYVRRSVDGSVGTQIICTSIAIPDVVKGGVPTASIYNPMCKHRFYLKELNALVTLNYSRLYIQDWHSLQTRVRALLLSFVKPASAQ
jgi:hypothetical protein